LLPGESIFACKKPVDDQSPEDLFKTSPVPGDIFQHALD